MSDEVKIQCPAAMQLGDKDKHLCRIERCVISRISDKNTIKKFCTGRDGENNHHRCPSWKTFQDEKIIQGEED